MTPFEQSTQMAEKIARALQSSERATQSMSYNLAKSTEAMTNMYERLAKEVGGNTVIAFTNLGREFQRFGEISRRGSGAVLENIADTVKKYKETQVLLDNLKASKKAGEEVSKKEMFLASKTVEMWKKRLDISKQEYSLSQLTLKGSTVYAGILTFSAAQLGKIVGLHRQINESVMDASSSMENRLAILKDNLAVQRSLGVSFDTAKDTARAMVKVGLENRDQFRETAKTIAMMKDGLGISTDTSADLARIYQTSLKVSFRSVADSISVIADQTALTAEHAARLSIEIGKAIRLLGPGMTAEIKETQKYLLRFAAEFEKLGGRPEEITETFKKMVGGRPESFMLRQFAGVTPAMLKTSAGIEKAQVQLGQFVDRIVTAGKGTNAYTVQLEMASQILGISTESIILWKQALADSKKPLDESQLLQKRYNEQTSSLTQSLTKLSNRFIALAQQALIPTLWALTKVANGADWLVSKITANNGLLTLLKFSLPVAVGIATIKFVGLIFSMKTLARSTQELIALQLALARAQTGTAVPKIGNWWQDLMGKTATVRIPGGTAAKMTGPVARQLPTFSKIIPPLLAACSWIGRIGMLAVRFLPLIGTFVTIAATAWSIFSLVKSMKEAQKAESQEKQAEKLRKLAIPGADRQIESADFFRKIKEIAYQTGSRQQVEDYIRERGADIRALAGWRQQSISSIIDQAMDEVAKSVELRIQTTITGGIDEARKKQLESLLSLVADANAKLSMLADIEKRWKDMDQRRQDAEKSERQQKEMKENVRPKLQFLRNEFD